MSKCHDSGGVVLDQLRGAPVREARDGQVGDMLERRLVLERLTEQGARIREQHEVLICLFGFAFDVAEAGRCESRQNGNQRKQSNAEEVSRGEIERGCETIVPCRGNRKEG